MKYVTTGCIVTFLTFRVQDDERFYLEIQNISTIYQYILTGNVEILSLNYYFQEIVKVIYVLYLNHHILDSHV